MNFGGSLRYNVVYTGSLEDVRYSTADLTVLKKIGAITETREQEPIVANIIIIGITRPFERLAKKHKHLGIDDLFLAL